MCEQPGCADVNGRPELLDRDLAQELTDVGQQPPIPEADRYARSRAVLSSCEVERV